MTYDTNNIDLVTISNGLGDVSITYNANHDITSITDRMGKTSTISYDNQGNLTGVTDPLGIDTVLIYNPNRQLQQITRDGQLIRFIHMHASFPTLTFTGSLFEPPTASCFQFCPARQA